MSDAALLAALFAQGLALHQQGQREAAKAVYARMLVLHPGHADALHMLGVIAMQGQNYALAAELLAASVQNHPANAAAHFNRGLALQALGRFEEALAALQQALLLRPDYAQAFNSKGAVLHACERYEEAVEALNQAIALDPGNAQAWNNRGVVLQAQSLWDEAAHSYAKAIAAQPDFGQAHYNLGNALHALGRYEEAVQSYDTAIALHTTPAHAYNNRGLALQELQRSAQALASYDAAIAIQADYADAHWNKAIELLLCGDFAQGWTLYEWRWQRESFSSRKRTFVQPLWLGDAALAGKTVLLHAEQGLGDSIQFCRYAPLVQACGARVVLEVPRPLMGLFTTLAGVSQLVEKGAPLPHFDYHCPLLSLPLAFQTRLETVPKAIPYLASTAAQKAYWHSRLGPPSQPRIGLVWSGNALDKNDGQRSVSLHSLLPFLPPGLEYISLQKELRPQDRHALQASGIRFFGSQIEDFSDTAALCELVDLVITVDTSVAHLAGALGKATWIMLPYAPDWRWLLHRGDSPWYPSARLYRQGPERSWEPVFERIAYDLNAYVGSGGPTS